MRDKKLKTHRHTDAHTHTHTHTHTQAPFKPELCVKPSEEHMCIAEKLMIATSWTPGTISRSHTSFVSHCTFHSYLYSKYR